jgi:hypothetical protein
MRHEAKQPQSPQVPQSAEPPELGGVRFGPALAGILYVLLVASAALTLWVRQAPGKLPEQLATLAPWLFLAFALIFAAYRFRLVRARKYPAAKAFFQIGSAALFFMFLLPHSQRPFRRETTLDDVQTFLQSPDPRLRAMAAEVAGFRPQGSQYGAKLTDLLEDPEPRVREQAHSALVRLYGKDLGPPGDKAATKAWREAYP